MVNCRKKNSFTYCNLSFSGPLSGLSIAFLTIVEIYFYEPLRYESINTMFCSLTLGIHEKTPNFGRAGFWAYSSLSGVCVRISAISWSISKIQRPSWRARQDGSNELSHISTASTRKSVAPQTLTKETGHPAV